jgi:hypothetical protein
MPPKHVEKTFMERRVFSGALVKRGYKVSAIQLVKCKKDQKPVETVKVKNQSEYSAGCSLHRGTCFGHVCETPTGNLLPPHSLSFRSGDIRTQYYIAATKAFEDKEDDYIEELKKTNYGKYGHLRSIMSTPVSGSARLVCIPHCFRNPRVLFISPNLASKILFCLPMQYEDGVQGPTYVERELREGDMVMLERPPSLSKFNNQPFRVLFWNLECIGIHPKVFSYFHGDYDGDEVHIYALGSSKSIAEAALWAHPLDEDLESALEYVKEHCKGLYEWDGTEGDMGFVEHTTLSFDEIREDKKRLAVGDWTRNGSSYNTMFSERISRGDGTNVFLKDARKGVKDIMRQQVSQGRIGDMSRIARISAMCVTRSDEGGTYMVCRKSRVLLNDKTGPSTGSPSVRCIMSLCQASQQAALDAHRVGSTESMGLDMISDLLKGRQEGGVKNKCHTLFVFEDTTVESVKQQMVPIWCCEIDSLVACVSYDSTDLGELLGNLCGAYSPIVLSLLPKERAKSVCRKALYVVYNYYKIKLEGDDIEDIVELMCFRVKLSKVPITTRDGMLARGLGWMETLMACDYTKTPAMAGSISAPYSATSATMCANFSFL